jgi:dihydropteroate synthase
MSRTLVMGIINVTPDSFSDGGRWFDPQRAVEHGLELIDQGADLLDIGGESTRPGAERVSEAEEADRVLPVIQALSGRGAVLSVDTMRAAVARQAVGAGAGIVNDVSGGLADPDMFATVAGLGTDYICQHWRGFGNQMNARAQYQDVVGEVVDELGARLAAAQSAGIEAERIIADPGLGFAKNAAHDWAILAHLDRFTALGHRVLIGASRKRFLAAVSKGPQPQDRDEATAAVTSLCALAGVWAVRVHAVPASRAAVEVVQQIALARGSAD